MGGYLLDAGATIKCPHGGEAKMVTSSTKVTLGGQPPLLIDDTSTISGCSLNISGAPSPCLRVQWQMPATRVKIESKAVLLSTSVGLCVNAGGAPQGSALVSGYQTKVQGQ
jgi:hypothetical protein